MKQILYIITILTIFISCDKKTYTPTPKQNPENKQEIVDTAKNNNGTANNNSSNNNNNVSNNNGDNKDNTGQDQNGGKNKLSDDVMALRIRAKWKVAPDVYLKAINIDSLYNNPTSIATKALKPLISFYSSSYDGSIIHDFTEEEIKDIQITNLTYDNNYINIKLSYKNINGAYISKLQFNQDDYYNLLFTVNPNFAKNYYLQGVYDNLIMYLTQILIYDQDKYIIDEVLNKNKTQSSISFSVPIRDKKTQKQLAIIHKEVNGFKSLNNLKEDLTFISSYDFDHLAKEKVTKLKGIKEGENFAPKIKNAMINQKWMEQTQIRYKNTYLEWDEDHNHIFYIMGQGANRDLYLYNPRFDIVSATIKDGVLTLVIQMLEVNEESLNDMTYTFTIRGVKLS